MLSNKQYFFLFLSLLVFSLILIGIFNYKVDPAGIYGNSPKGKRNGFQNDYALRLIHSKYGLIWPDSGLNEREIKIKLASMVKNTTCAVIGSSHVMQISSSRKNKSFRDRCFTLINLAVSGATLEDYVSLSWELIQNPESPKIILIGIDPWALSYNRDPRWEIYHESFEAMKKEIQGKKKIEGSKEQNVSKVETNTAKYYLNLINIEYLIRSIQGLGKRNFEIQEASEFDIQVGFDLPVLLPDASLVYSKKSIDTAKTEIVPKGGIRYKEKLFGSNYNSDAVLFFTDAIKYIKSTGKKVILFKTPYHPNVWEDVESIPVRNIREVEPIINAIAKDAGVELLGSYRPEEIGCNDPSVFIDHQHPKETCLVKLK